MATVHSKQEILDKIKRLAAAGKSTGKSSFKADTGIDKKDWYPDYWLRWGDALLEAGLQPNPFGVRFSEELLVKKYIELIRELGRFPIAGDLLKKRLTDNTFPNAKAFHRRGSKAQNAGKILEYCRNHDGYDDIITFCSEVVSKSPVEADDQSLQNRAVGYVYLFKHGSRREYKVGKTSNPLRREGEIAIQLPEKLQPIHHIKTDDPSGIEKYWKDRFTKEGKHKEGEWFALAIADVRAFKRWKRIY